MYSCYPVAVFSKPCYVTLILRHVQTAGQPVGPLNLLQDLVTTIVTFNRALYAQLAQQQFQPPRGYPMPASNSPALRAAELGMKLTCGFEMVMVKGSSGAIP